MVVRNVEVEYTGGGKLSQAPVIQPGNGVHRLPAWGFYARNVDGLTLDDIRLRVRDTDERPVLRMENVSQLRMNKVAHPPLPPGAEPFDLRDVKQVEK